MNILRANARDARRLALASGFLLGIVGHAAPGTAAEANDLTAQYVAAAAELTAAIATYENLTAELAALKQKSQVAMQSTRTARQAYSSSPTSENRQLLRQAQAAEDAIVTARVAIAQRRDQALTAVEDARAAVAAAGLALDRAGVPRPSY